MKRVRLIGAVGAAPVLGLMMPVTAGAAPAPGSTAKAVRSAASPPASPSPNAGCAGHTGIKGSSRNFHFEVWHTEGTSCVGGVTASLNKLAGPLPGLDLRTRAYSISGSTKRKWFSGYARGISFGSPDGIHTFISYYQGIHQVRFQANQVCEAIVDAADHSNVYRGPVCVSF